MDTNSGNEDKNISATVEDLKTLQGYTPTPWTMTHTVLEASSDSDSAATIWRTRKFENGEVGSTLIAEVSRSAGHETAVKNARFIVRAANDYEADKKALRGVAIMLNTELAKYETEPWAQRVRAALA